MEGNKADGAQDGAFTEDQVTEAQKDPWLEAKLAVRRWDDSAKTPNLTVPPLEVYEEMAYECLLGEHREYSDDDAR
jgi:predicted HD phosphohydrolase